AVFAAAALLIAAIIAGIVLLNSRDHTAAPSSSASRSTSRPSSSPASSTPPPTTASASSSASASTTAGQSSTAASSSASSSASQVGGTPTAAQLAKAIRDYYGLLPQNTDEAWSRLTEQYQNGRAGGRQSYDDFWGGIRRVSVSNATGIPPGTVEATITYGYEDGRVVSERTSFGLVSEDGILKINSSAVLSSQGG
ncbi:MAG: eukaryotic-like serine/threonine-protein kinase, partial [Pseudonocardiales bacterium]|nr:eukaryotic-like serine/threonine-protein kinase [Pseudonocardiales bacterium]